MENHPVSAVAHVGVSVTDIATSVSFYRDIIELEILHQAAVDGSRFAFLGRNGAVVLTLWEQAGAPFSPERAGLHHLAFQASDQDALEAVGERLRARGLSPRFDGVVAHLEGASSAAIYFEDPDGLRIEVTAPSTSPDTLPAPTGAAPACGFF